MRDKALTRSAGLFIWRNKATVISFTPAGKSDAIRVRLINPASNRIYDLLKEWRVTDAAHMTPRGLGFDVVKVDGWIYEFEEEVRIHESRWLQHDRNLNSAKDPYADDPRYEVWKVCDPQVVTRLINAIDGNKSSSGRKRILERLAENPYRMLPKVTREHIDAVQEVALSFPNFNALTAEIVLDLSLKMRLGEVLTLPHLLLHGAPGVGKSLFARRLADALGFYYREFSFAQMTAGFLLTGNSDQWATSAIGLLADAVINAPAGKVPLIFGDEIDKSASDKRYPTDTVLLSALEPNTAATFCDEYLGCQIDLRPLNFIFAANVVGNIKPEVLSRLTPVSVRLPTDDEMPAVIRSIDRDLRTQRPGISSHFEPLDDAVLSRLTSTAPRQLYQTLKRAYALAANQETGPKGLIRLQAEHLGIPPPEREAAPPKRTQIQPSPDQMAKYVARQALYELELMLWDTGKKTPH
ncbi:MAG: AAA family ATPase [Nevskia sp.]|nr:AAA family ATPase [Nevskia sp.]